VSCNVTIPAATITKGCGVAKAANFQITDYYKGTIVVYLHAKVIRGNGDWNENKIVIYADSSHTKKSCEAMAAFIFRLVPTDDPGDERLV